MKRTLHLVLVLAILWAPALVHGDGFVDPGRFPVVDPLDKWCIPENSVLPVKPTDISAPYYAFQVPVLFRNEQTDEEFWVYARACVPWAVDENGKQTRIGPGYSNVSIIDPNSAAGALWTFADVNPDSFTQTNDQQRKLSFSGDDFAVFSRGDPASLTVYVPQANSPKPNNAGQANDPTYAPRVELVTVPHQVRAGVTTQPYLKALPDRPEEVVKPVPLTGKLSEVDMLSLAGFLMAGYEMTPPFPATAQQQGFWTEYSTQFKFRSSYTGAANRRQFTTAWLNARYLLCDPQDNTLRPNMNANFARTLMVRDPLFPWTLASTFDCSNPFKDSIGSEWKWGGGIGVFSLFPNLTLKASHLLADGKVKVTGSLLNKSSGKGAVYLFYRWSDSEPWKLGSTGSIGPYQSDAPFAFEVPVPSGQKRLQVFAAPGAETGLALIDPDPAPTDQEGKPLDPAVTLGPQRTDDRPVVTEVRNYTEFKVSDNYYAADLTCGDLTVKVLPAADGTTAGFNIRATAYRTGCETLTFISIDINVNGVTQRKTAYFAGDQATVTFISGPQNSGLMEVRAWVDPLNEVPETNETNNGDKATIAVISDDEPAVECPSGVPQEECFTTIITH